MLITIGDDEIALLVRLSKVLLSSVGVESKWIGCSMENCEKCLLKDEVEFCSLRTEIECSWLKIIKGEGKESMKELLLQTILKENFYNWILCEVHEDGLGLKAFDDERQGVIHLVAALGFDWAIAPMVRAGVEVGYQDVQGQTAYHWAFLYGRLECMGTLDSILNKSLAVEVEKSLPVVAVEEALPVEANRRSKPLRADKKKQQVAKKGSAPSKKKSAKFECQLCRRVVDSEDAFNKHVESHVFEFRQAMQFEQWKETMLKLMNSQTVSHAPSPSEHPCDEEPSTSGRE